MSDYEFRPPGSEPRRNASGSRFVLWLVLLIAALAAGWWGWTTWQQRQAAKELGAEQASAQASIGQMPPTAIPSAPASPDLSALPQFPVGQEAATGPLPPLDQADAAVEPELDSLVGSKRVTALLQSEGFVRRVVATVDNLTREHAASRLWPVQPTAGKFTVAGAPGSERIAEDNAGRYTPVVLMLEQVDVKRAADVYRRLYPLFQQAYEELGYPGKYFNDRLVAVIDHLLAAPEPAGPVRLHLTEVRGEVPSVRPWVRYEYDDPALESLSSGQKMMVRVGLVNERRLKARLRAVRSAVVGIGTTDVQKKPDLPAQAAGPTPAKKQ
jgi:hypothetical protein